jgi:hypothetical protein
VRVHREDVRGFQERVEVSCQSMPSAGRSSVVLPHCSPWESKEQITSTVFPVSGSRFDQHSRAPLSISWKWMLRSQCSAGFSRRTAFSRAMYGASDRPPASAPAQSRGRSSYFSLSMYSSAPGRGTCSKSSNPAYMPQDGDSRLARTARILNIGGPPCHSGSGRMSGVLGQKLGRM